MIVHVNHTFKSSFSGGVGQWLPQLIGNQHLGHFAAKQENLSGDSGMGPQKRFKTCQKCKFRPQNTLIPKIDLSRYGIRPFPSAKIKPDGKYFRYKVMHSYI